MHLPVWKRPEVQNFAVLTFNNYSRYNIDLWILFLPIDSFAVQFFIGDGYQYLTNNLEIHQSIYKQTE